MPESDFESVYIKALSNAKAFALWRMPDEKQAHLVAQLSTEIFQWSDGDEGFIFHPFAVSQPFPPIFIKAEAQCTINPEEIPHSKEQLQGWILTEQVNQQFAPSNTFIQFIQKSINAIEQHQFQKIVAARASQLPFYQPIEALLLFKKLCTAYPHAFISMVQSKIAGTWFGATPEVLLKNHDGHLQTMALAGTVPFQENRDWTGKEKEEQLLVKTFIEEAFLLNGLNPEISETKELIAGNSLKHLVNYFDAALPVNFTFGQLRSLITHLHPTPAVAGLPKQAAIEWILQNEPLTRSYYSGFLGPVYADNSCDLFVNLRCMQLLEHNMILYAGAGITAASDPEAEWDETRRKMQTIRSVINTLHD